MIIMGDDLLGSEDGILGDLMFSKIIGMIVCYDLVYIEGNIRCLGQLKIKEGWNQLCCMIVVEDQGMSCKD